MIQTLKMPARIPFERSGKTYLPSNGTEGDMFQVRWCERCTKENYDDIWCPILTKSFGQNVKEWVFDDEGIPKCTAFKGA